MIQQILPKVQFDLLFGNSNDLVFYMEKVGDDYKYIYLNAPSIQLLSEDAIGKNISDIMDEKYYQVILENYNLAVERKKQVCYEDYQYRSSEVKKYETSVIPIFVEDKTFILAITKEITFERDLQDKYLFMRSVFFNTFLSTVLVSSDGRLLEANPQFLQDFNLNIEDVRWQHFSDLSIFTPKNAKQFKRYLDEACKGKNLSSKFLSFVDKDGMIRSFTATFSPIFQNNEESFVVGVFVILQEITEIIKKEKELKSTATGLWNLKYAIDNAADMSITDLNGIIIDVNDRFIEQTGYSKEELLGATHQIVNSGFHSKEFFQKLWETIQSGTVWRGELCNRTKFGSIYWVDTTIIPLLDEKGNIQQFMSVHYNITQKKRMITELRNIERMFKMINDNTNDLIVITNEDGIILYASSAYTRKLGYHPDELIGQCYSKVLSGDCKELWKEELLNIDHNVNSKLELIHTTKNGEALWTECNYTVVNDYSRKHGFQIIMVAREITERKKIENQLLFLAYHDSLTQLPNRRYIQQEFPNIIEEAKARNTSIAVLYVDGDNFKDINDRYGHEVGDAFLNHFGRALQSSVRSNDLVVRIGGDEFAIVLTGLVKNKQKRDKQVKQIIDRIKESLQNGWVISNQQFSPTSSIGVSFYPDHGTKLEELLHLADRALYDVKTISKNNYKIYQS
mgnify:FL=1